MFLHVHFILFIFQLETTKSEENNDESSAICVYTDHLCWNEPSEVFSPWSNAANLCKGIFFCTGFNSTTLLNEEINKLIENKNISLDEGKALRITNNNLTMLKPKELNIYGSLVRLWAEENTIGIIPSEAFTGLNNIKEIIISSNVIEKLEGGCFKQLNNLQTLEINNNTIKNLTSGLFINLKLQSLFFYDNKITRLENITFANIPSLQDFKFYNNNNIRNLTLDTFSGTFPHLSELNLLSNNIQNITPGVFKPFNELQELIITGNPLKELKPQTFIGMISLRNLNLKNNNLTYLHNKTFEGLFGLRHLNLDSNNISVLKPNYFKGLSLLENLSLNDNKLKLIPSGVFGQLNKLNSLSLRENEISVLEADAFDGLYNLEYLSLSYNKIEVFDSDLVSKLNVLITLELEANDLKERPKLEKKSSFLVVFL